MRSSRRRAVETVLRELSLRGGAQLLDRQPGTRTSLAATAGREAEPTSVPAGTVMFGGRKGRHAAVAGSTAERLATLEARVALGGCAGGSAAR